MVCIHLTHDKDQWWAVIILIMNVQVSQKVRNFLNGSTTISLKRWTLLHEVNYKKIYIYVKWTDKFIEHKNKGDSSTVSLQIISLPSILIMLHPCLSQCSELNTLLHFPTKSVTCISLYSHFNYFNLLLFVGSLPQLTLNIYHHSTILCQILYHCTFMSTQIS